MDADPSRRGLLAACGVGLGTILAGCASRQSDTDDEGSTTTTAPMSTDVTTGVGAAVTAENQHDEAVTLTVALRSDGETLRERTATLSAGVTTGLDIDVPAPGTYTVVAGVEGSAETASTEWTVSDSFRERLDVRLAADGTLTLWETVHAGDCGGDVPYAVPGNEETFRAAPGAVRNESGERTTVTVSVAHDGTTFFECTRPIDANQTVVLGDLTETAGEYAVTVAVANGGRTTYDWRIPPENNWPRLRVVLPESGDPLVGCGTDGSVDATISNDGGEPRSVQLVLRRDGTRVADETASVAAGEESTVALEVPIGGVYTLHATTDAGEATTEVVYCDCYGDRRLTVTVYDGGVVLDSERLVCE